MVQVMWTSMVYLIGRQPQVGGQFSSLQGVGNVWGQTLSIATFTLTFFVNQSFSLFKAVIAIARTLQGRCKDLMMAVAASAQRVERVERVARSQYILEVSQYTPASRDFFLTMARYVRLFNIPSYASFTRSQGHE